MTETANPVGRPSDYQPEYAEQAKKLCLLGATDQETADFFNVHVATIYRWKHSFPEFCEAIKSGKDVADERVERSLYQNATGYEYTEQQAFKVKVDKDREEIEVVDVQKHARSETVAAIFWLKNRRPDQWRDKQEFEHTGRNGSALHPVPDLTLLSVDTFNELLTISQRIASTGDAGADEPGEPTT